MRIFKNKIIFLYFFRGLCGLGGIIEVPQIWLYFPLVSGSGGQISLRPPIFNSLIYTDFFATCAADDKRGTQITQMTQIFLTYSVRFTQIFPSSSYFENPCIGQMSYHHNINDFSILFAL